MNFLRKSWAPGIFEHMLILLWSLSYSLTGQQWVAFYRVWNAITDTRVKVKVKLSFCLTKHHATKTYWDWRYSSTHSSTLALGGGEWTDTRIPLRNKAMGPVTVLYQSPGGLSELPPRFVCCDPFYKELTFSNPFMALRSGNTVTKTHEVVAEVSRTPSWVPQVKCYLPVFMQGNMADCYCCRLMTHTTPIPWGL
jgi:hypothetical protein